MIIFVHFYFPFSIHCYIIIYKGYNIGWNVNEVGGQEIFHAHLHVIPRYEDEPMSGKGIRYWIKQPQNKRIHL